MRRSSEAPEKFRVFIAAILLCGVVFFVFKSGINFMSEPLYGYEEDEEISCVHRVVHGVKHTHCYDPNLAPEMHEYCPPHVLNHKPLTHCVLVIEKNTARGVERTFKNVPSP